MSDVRDLTVMATGLLALTGPTAGQVLWVLVLAMHTLARTPVRPSRSGARP